MEKNSSFKIFFFLLDQITIKKKGPLPNTSGHFWLMIWEQKSRAILMLNNLIECGKIKCHKYWPDGQNQDDIDELFFDDVSLKVQLKSMEKFNFYILRTFVLYDLLVSVYHLKLINFFSYYHHMNID